MKNYHLKMMALLYIINPVHAAEFCVTSSASLQAALDSAESNNENDFIKIAEGSYVTPGEEFSFYGVDSWDLEISGGWTDFFGNPCGQQLNGSAFNTILDGDHMNRVMRIQASGTADIKISNLMLVNGYLDGFTPGGGLIIYGTNSGYLGDITVEQMAFMNNTANSSSAASILYGHKMVVRNCLIAANHSNFGPSISLQQLDSFGVYFTNNTIYLNTHNTSPGFGDGSGASVYVTGSSQALIANNLLWANDNHDLVVAGDGTKYIHYNNWGSINSGTPFSEIGNSSLPPRFDDGLLNFTPSTTSPLVNAGRKPCTICPFPVPFDEAWALGSSDMQGDVRVQSGAVDIGAFESPYEPDLIFMNSVE